MRPRDFLVVGGGQTKEQNYFDFHQGKSIVFLPPPTMRKSPCLVVGCWPDINLVM